MKKEAQLTAFSQQSFGCIFPNEAQNDAQQPLLDVATANLREWFKMAESRLSHSITSISIVQEGQWKHLIDSHEWLGGKFL